MERPVRRVFENFLRIFVSGSSTEVVFVSGRFKLATFLLNFDIVLKLGSQKALNYSNQAAASNIFSNLVIL